MNASLRSSALASLMLALALTAGCTVRPMLATQAGTAGEDAARQFSSVAVAPVGTRYGQQVRNHLLFLLHGGAGEPANPRYGLALSVTSRTIAAAEIQTGSENEPTAGLVILAGDYTLTDSATGAVVSRGRQEVSAAFDRPPQEFAVLRAERDAQDRAARELAELLNLAVAQDIARLDAR